MRLVPGARLADARHDRVARVAHLARLVAEDARADPLGGTGAQLRADLRVSDVRAGHLDRIADAVRDGPLGLAGVDHRSLQHDARVRSGGLQRGTHRAAGVDVEPGRFVEIGARLLRREDRAADDDHEVDAS